MKPGDTSCRRKRSTLLLAIVPAALLSWACGHHVNRDFFVKGHGIGVTDPQPDKDGTWWLGIEHVPSGLHSSQLVQRWDAEVIGDKIVVRAFVVESGRLNLWWYGLPESGAHIDSLQEGQYRIVYRDGDDREWPLGSVMARIRDVIPTQRWQWSGSTRPPDGPDPASVENLKRAAEQGAVDGVPSEPT